MKNKELEKLNNYLLVSKEVRTALNINMENEEMKDWFYSNYIEDNQLIDELILKMQVKTICSISNLYRSCICLKKVFPERNVLSRECLIFGEMANRGFADKDAAEMLIILLMYNKI